jgi:hypothetical protein
MMIEIWDFVGVGVWVGPLLMSPAPHPRPDKGILINDQNEKNGFVLFTKRDFTC